MREDGSRVRAIKCLTCCAVAVARMTTVIPVINPAATRHTKFRLGRPQWAKSGRCHCPEYGPNADIKTADKAWLPVWHEGLP